MEMCSSGEARSYTRKFVRRGVPTFAIALTCACNEKRRDYPHISMWRELAQNPHHQTNHARWGNVSYRCSILVRVPIDEITIVASLTLPELLSSLPASQLARELSSQDFVGHLASLPSNQPVSQLESFLIKAQFDT